MGSIGTILGSAGMDFGNIVSLRTYLSHPKYDEQNVRMLNAAPLLTSGSARERQRQPGFIHCNLVKFSRRFQAPDWQQSLP